jgi:DNA-binding MarR family transcriptional regulator
LYIQLMVCLNVKNIENQLKNSMGTLIGRTSHAILNKLQKKFREEGYNITVEQWQVLINLNNTNHQFHQQLAENTFKEKSTITRLLDGLEKKNLVKRVSDAVDRRQKRIRITTRGKSLLNKLKPFALEVQGRAINDIDLKQMKICQDILLKVYNNVIG